MDLITTIYEVLQIAVVIGAIYGLAVLGKFARRCG